MTSLTNEMLEMVPSGARRRARSAIFCVMLHEQLGAIETSGWLE
jgi:hypothetical protein